MRSGSDDQKRGGKAERAAGAGYTPVLGLFSGEEPGREAEPRVQQEDRPPAPLELSVIIPARDEERNLPGCLGSLLRQQDRIFSLGTDWELLVVDDGSTDGTRRLAEAEAARFGSEGGGSGVRVLEAPALVDGPDGRSWTGKNNACWAGAQAAQGRWLLFTDADTRHEPGDLRRALHEAERNGVKLLSYSPRQVMHGVAQRLVMPLIFSELASVYPPAKVNDPADRTAAANGQFLLIERDAYFAVGGHRAVGPLVLEDVALARNVNGRGMASGCGTRRMRFRQRCTTGSVRWWKAGRRTWPHCSRTRCAWRCGECWMCASCCCRCCCTCCPTW